jgi:hypothetical protein
VLLWLRKDDSSEIQGKENVRRWKPLPRNGSENVIVGTIVCVCMCNSNS